MREGCWSSSYTEPKESMCSNTADNTFAHFVRSGKLKLQLHAQFCRGPRGAKILIDPAKQIVVLEAYLYD